MQVSHMIKDHKEACDSAQSDTCCIEKLNATFSEHKDMAAHIQSLDAQDGMLS